MKRSELQVIARNMITCQKIKRQITFKKKHGLHRRGKRWDRAKLYRKSRKAD